MADNSIASAKAAATATARVNAALAELTDGFGATRYHNLATIADIAAASGEPTVAELATAAHAAALAYLSALDALDIAADRWRRVGA